MRIVLAASAAMVGLSLLASGVAAAAGRGYCPPKIVSVASGWSDTSQSQYCYQSDASSGPVASNCVTVCNPATALGASSFPPSQCQALPRQDIYGISKLITQTRNANGSCEPIATESALRAAPVRPALPGRLSPVHVAPISKRPIEFAPIAIAPIAVAPIGNSPIVVAPIHIAPMQPMRPIAPMRVMQMSPTRFLTPSMPRMAPPAATRPGKPPQ